MKRTGPQPSLTIFEEDKCEKQQDEGEGRPRRGKKEEGDGDKIEDVAKNVQCMTLYRQHSSKKGEELSRGKYDLWREEQKVGATILGKQLKAEWEFEELIEEQLNRFHARYNHGIIPTRLKDVSLLFMPKWIPPHELAALIWLGDWRPSAILDLVQGLAFPSSLSLSSSSSDSNGIERLLSQLIQEISTEEAVIDEEMAEIQATCILHLPFAPANSHRPGTAALSCIQAEFKKIERVITKAQQLRFKTLELVTTKVLSHADAAAFLVAFAGIQDVIHKFAAKQKLPKSSVTVPVKALGHC